jgi:hypothetical protein
MLGVVALWLAYSAVDVVGDGDCPASADVRHRLAELIPATNGGPEPLRRARLSRSEKGLHVELLSAGGERMAERDLGVDASCDDLAAASAVIIATWEAELDPRLTTPRVSLRTPPRQTTPVTTAVRATPPPPQSPPSFDLGLALMASLTGGEVAPGARVGAWIAPGGWRLGLGAAVSATTARSEPVGPGPAAARWTRYALGAGPEARFAIGRMMVGAHARALAALLRVEGVGLPTTASDSTAQFGTGAGVHVGRPWGNATPWIGADLLFWPGRDRLEISGLAARGELPRLELQLALGLSIGRFP